MTDERHDENGRTHVLTERIMRKLRGDADQRRGDNGRGARSVSYTSITILISVAGAMGALGMVAMDVGAQKQRIETIEKRQVEDRTDTGSKINRVEVKVEKIDGNVNLILQEIRAMQAEQRAERRTARRAD